MKNRIGGVGPSLGLITLNGWVALYNVHLNNDQPSPNPIHLTMLIIHENILHLDKIIRFFKGTL